MPTLFDRFRSLLTRPPEVLDAPDGSYDTLRSGKWVAHQLVPIEAFPAALLLNETDQTLYGRASEQIVLATTRVGQHSVELLLWASNPNAVGLGLRIPTAKNQYKEPYLLMEAEGGNTREDAVREVNFHLAGRVSEDQVSCVNWTAFFRSAASKLEDLRTVP